MNYPDKIYSKFEIVEKDICGEKHYGLVKIYNVFGFKFKRHIKVWEMFLSKKGTIASGRGNKWHNKRTTIESAIDEDNHRKEYLFRERVTK